MEEIFDPIRQLYVPALPEEVVRQKLILRLLKMGFPKSLLAVEKDISSLEHIWPGPKQDIKRRADLIAFANFGKGSSLKPLLLVECKAVFSLEEAVKQALGYNAYVQACFVAVVSEKWERTLWNEGGIDKWVDFIPSYKELLQNAEKSCL